MNIPVDVEATGICYRAYKYDRHYFPSKRVPYCNPEESQEIISYLLNENLFVESSCGLKVTLAGWWRGYLAEKRLYGRN